MEDSTTLVLELDYLKGQTLFAGKVLIDYQNILNSIFNYLSYGTYCKIQIVAGEFARWVLLERILRIKPVLTH